MPKVVIIIDPASGRQVAEEVAAILPTLSSYEQSFSEATSWIVNHNLGRRPIVALFSQGGAEIMAEVIHISSNQFIAYFASPIAGGVRCV